MKPTYSSAKKPAGWEIKEMKWLISDIQENGKAITDAEAALRPVPDFKGQFNGQ